MASLYNFSSDTLSNLQKFRFASGRASSMQAVIYEIDKETHEVRPEDGAVIGSLDELAEELPPNNPRFVVLSYPHTTADGRLKSPLVLVYWRPPTCGQQSKMLYAAAVELIREKAGVSKLIEVTDEDEFEDLPLLL